MTTALGWWAESFVVLSGIPSEEAFGALSPGGFALYLNGIASGEAFGNTVVQGPPQTVELVGIPSAEAFGGSGASPGAADVELFGITSGETFGTATVTRGAVNIGPNGIPSGEAFGTMKVANELEIVGVAVSNTDTVTIPTHQVGDLIVLAVERGNNSALATKPSAGGTVPAWVDIDANAGGNSCSMRTARFVATATNTTTGTWTGANGMVAVVIRGQAASPIGGHAEALGSSTTEAVAPAVTMTKTDGSSILLHFFSGSIGGSTWGSAPSGYTQQATNSDVCCLTKNVTTSDGSVSQSRTASLGRYRGATVEVLAQ